MIPNLVTSKQHTRVKTGWGWDFNYCFKIGMGVHTPPRPRFGRGWERDRGVSSKIRPIAIPIHSLYIITQTPICDPNHTLIHLCLLLCTGISCNDFIFFHKWVDSISFWGAQIHIIVQKLDVFSTSKKILVESILP